MQTPIAFTFACTQNRIGGGIARQAALSKVPKGPRRTKNTTRSKFTTRSIFSTAG